MMPKWANTPTKSALVKSVGLHLTIAAVLLISVVVSPPPLPELPSNQPVIKATFIDAQAIYEKQQAEQKAQQLAQAKKAEERRKEKARQEKIAREKAAADAKRKADAEAAKQRKLEQIAKQQELDKKRKLEEQKAEQERQRKEAQRQAELERQKQEQLAQEQAAQRQRRQQQVLTEVERYQALIKQTIMRYLIEDSDFAGKQCRLNIRLATTGLVTKVTVMSGDGALCRAAQAAVLRPDKLPVSAEADVYEELKNINLTVEL